ncbi:Gamma-butyrobetaine dioxygenase [Armadillidium vulgare]|nr:Gamma-butyrobetaine dioxygenase [Armadillidium vulgare]
MKPWGKNLQLSIFNYEDIMRNESSLLNWLLTMEATGATLIKNCPNDLEAGPKLSEKIGFVKMTHYGRRSPVVVRPDSNNIAFTSVKLGLHNDIPQYIHQPGIILLHTLEQHRGVGGESTISDGFLATEILRKENPEAFDILTNTCVYFWDKGRANNPLENEEFYKINKAPIIGLNRENKFEIMRVNNQVRDSHLDLPADQVNSFYEAMKALGDILEANCYGFKMEDGDLLVLDNFRCQHGREKFENDSSRHLETSYMDWDEALCCRRRLVEKLGIQYPPKDL